MINTIAQTLGVMSGWTICDAKSFYGSQADVHVKWVGFIGMHGEQPWKVQVAFNFILNKLALLLTKHIGWSSSF